VVPVPTVDEKDDGTTMLRMTTDAAPVEQLNYDPPFEPVIGPDGSKTWSGLSFSTGIGYRPVLLDVRVPAFTNATAAGTPTPLPALMWVHGGAWWAGDRRYLPPTLAPGELADAALARGMAYVAVDYRLALEAPFPAQIHDVKAAIRYVRRFADVFGIDADRLGALGESAGGHLVALLALTAGIAAIDGTEGVPDGRSDVAAVVDWYGVHDIRAWAGEQSGDEPSPIAMLLGQASGAPDRHRPGRVGEPGHVCEPDGRAHPADPRGRRSDRPVLAERGAARGRNRRGHGHRARPGAGRGPLFRRLPGRAVAGRSKRRLAGVAAKRVGSPSPRQAGARAQHPGRRA